MPTTRSIRPPAVAVTATTLVVLFALAAGATERRSTMAGAALAHAVVGPMADHWFAISTVQLPPRGDGATTFDAAAARAARRPVATVVHHPPAPPRGMLHTIDLPPPARG